MTTQPYPFQEEGHQQIELFNGRAIVGFEMGLGKSFQALYYLYHHPEITRTLVICPASAKWHWQHQALHHINLDSEILSHRKTPKRGTLLKRCRLLIINYDILAWWRSWLSGNPETPDDKGYDPDLVIIDEAHYLLNKNSGRTRAAKAICKNRKCILALTGTPLINRPSELWPVLNITRPDLFPNFYPYAMKFCAPKRKPWGWDFSGSSNLEELHKILIQHVLIRKRKIDVLSDLPEKMLNIVPLPIDNRDEYNKARDNFLSWIRDTYPGREERAAKAERITQIGHLKRLAATGKMSYVIEWIQNFLQETDEKLLVFGIHIKILDQVQEKFRKICVRVDGSVIGEKRDFCFKAFNNDPKLRLFLGNIDAAGVIWSCSSSSNVAFIELPWSSAKVNQAIDRVHGVGRGIPGHPVRAWFLVARKSTEERLCDLLQRKQRIANTVIDGDPSISDFNLFDKLTETIQQEKNEERREHEAQRTLFR